MSELSPFDAVLEEDTRRVLQSADGGRPHELRALYGQPGAEVRPGQAAAPGVSTAPALHLSRHDARAALGRDPCARDRVAVQGRPYRILSVMDDGYGWLECRLLEAAHV